MHKILVWQSFCASVLCLFLEISTHDGKQISLVMWILAQGKVLYLTRKYFETPLPELHLTLGVAQLVQHITSTEQILLDSISDSGALQDEDLSYMAQCLHRPNATLMSKRHPFGRHNLEENVNSILKNLNSDLHSNKDKKFKGTEYRNCAIINLS